MHDVIANEGDLWTWMLDDLSRGAHLLLTAHRPSFGAHTQRAPSVGRREAEEVLEGMVVEDAQAQVELALRRARLHPDHERGLLPPPFLGAGLDDADEAGELLGRDRFTHATDSRSRV